MPKHPKCPKCGRKSRKVIEGFIKGTIDSAMFNLFDSGSYLPIAWSHMCVGDDYFMFAFEFLEFVAKKEKVQGFALKMATIPEKRIGELAKKFMKKTDLGDYEFFAPTFEAYLTEVLRQFLKQEE
jgi:hypothetical protein